MANKKKLKVSELLKSLKLLFSRTNSYKKSKKVDIPQSNINKVARELHPGEITLKLVEIIEDTSLSKIFRFVSIDKAIPLFEAGQFMTISFQVGNSYVTRPYSISSAPYETQGDNPYIEIAVKRVKEGFVSDYLLDTAKVGDLFTSLIGLGQFNYDYIRDGKDVVAIAGGSGITPFISMAKEIENGTLDFNLTILYGSRKNDEIMCKTLINSLKSNKIKVINVLSEEPNYDGEKGFITREIISKYSTPNCTYFMCGPSVMINFVNEELKALGVTEKRIVRDHLQQPKVISSCKDYPQEYKDKTFNLRVRLGVDHVDIPCSSNESILVALERSSIKLNNSCRGGYCGFCRTKLISGNVYTYKDIDYRREADKEFNYIHACASYPLSDLEIKIPIK